MARDRLGGPSQGAYQDIEVWFLRSKGTDPTSPALLEVLSDGEQERATRIQAASTRHLFITGRVLLRTVLGRRLDCPAADIELVLGPNGKPALAPPTTTSGLAFNLSHSAELAVLAVASADTIGIDVEHLRSAPTATRLADRYFSPEESRHIAAISDPTVGARAFFHCWTSKEAVVKASGGPLVPGLKAIEVDPDHSAPPRVLRVPAELGTAEEWSLLQAAIDPDYLCVVAVRGQGWRLRCRELELC